MNDHAESLTCLAVAEIVETFFAHVPPESRAELMAALRPPILSAVLGCAAPGGRKRLRRKFISLRPSDN